MADNQNYANDNGTLYCNKNILLSIVCLATKEVSGVVDTYNPMILRINKLVSPNVNDGVKIKYSKSGLYIDVYIVIQFDYEVNDVVYRVQQNIKNSINSMIELPIKAINVHIMDAVQKA
ncbi:MAG: Asp23/Gls24 family envelope stress response protein [Clostridia bacterium]|nr:Asp23/Gls24 family envelope stress response protein [Clostridia bacterium]